MPFLNEPSLLLERRGAPVSVPLREIYFIESRGHTVCVHTGGETIVAYERLENILRSLPAGFYLCHKSFIVNMGRIRRFEPGGILLKNGETVPVSRAKYAATKKAYFDFIGKSF
jgi:DNA-binding LytR/AlgR family response regulator